MIIGAKTTDENLFSKEHQEIKDEAEMLASRLLPLFPKHNYTTEGAAVKMNSFDRPAMVVWPKVYENLRLSSWTQNEAIAWLQSKGLRWFLDAEEDSLFEDAAIQIASAADKTFLEDPAEITIWPDINENLIPDLFISRTEEDGVKVYSNHPELLGKILVLEPPNDTTNATEFTLYNPEPAKLKGEYDVWYDSFEERVHNLKDFLENFIIKNT